MVTFEKSRVTFIGRDGEQFGSGGGVAAKSWQSARRAAVSLCYDFLLNGAVRKENLPFFSSAAAGAPPASVAASMASGGK